MADLAAYREYLLANPQLKNDGPWYARSNIEHDGRKYTPGSTLPDLTNEQVIQLLDVNALTSVAPERKEEFQLPSSELPGATPQAAQLNTFGENRNETPTEATTGQPNLDNVEQPQLTAEQEAARQAELQRQQASGELPASGSERIEQGQ